MPVSFEPHLRLQHLEDYVRKIHLNLPLPEARVQLLRCRLVGYSLAAQLREEGYTKKYIDQLMTEAYTALRMESGEEVIDPYKDPCASQYLILDELKSYTTRDLSLPFMRFLRSEFKMVFVPTLRLMTDLCKSKNKYSWEEAKAQLQEVMLDLKVDVSWEDCEARLDHYLNRVAPLLQIDPK